MWQLHEAKARFSELFRKAQSEGPQRVVKQGGGEVVIVSAEEWDARQQSSNAVPLVDFLREAFAGADLDLTRKKDVTRTIKW